MAQIPRAILPAKAMATSMRGFRDNMRASHVPSAAPFREAQFTTAIAPVTRRRRISRWPIFDVLPRRCFPPLEFCFGTRPSHAAKSRPRLNWSALLQRLAAVRGRLSLCADQAAAAKWWLSMPMASVSAEGPMPKALSTRRTSPLMPGCRHQGRACPLRRARMTSNPLIVA